MIVQSRFGSPNFYLLPALSLVVLSLPINYKTSFLSLLLLAVVALINFYTTRKYSALPKFLAFLMAGYVVRLIWVFRAHDLAEAWKTLENECPLLLVPLIFCLFQITENMRFTLSRVYIVMVAGLWAFTLYKFVLDFHESGLCGFDYLASHFDNAQYNTQQKILNWRSAHYSFLSVIAVFGVPISVFMEMKDQNSKLILIILYHFCLFIFLIFIGSKIGLVLFGSSLIIVTVLQRGWLASKVFVGLAVIMTLIFFSWFSLDNYFKIDPARSTMLQIAIDAIKKAPWLGHGTGAGTEIMHDKDFEYHYSYKVNHPHNQYFSELIQFGIIGTIPLILFTVFSLMDTIRAKNNLLLTVLVCYFLFMAVESPLNSQKGSLPFLIIVGIWGYRMPGESKSL